MARRSLVEGFPGGGGSSSTHSNSFATTRGGRRTSFQCITRARGEGEAYHFATIGNGIPTELGRAATALKVAVAVAAPFL